MSDREKTEAQIREFIATELLGDDGDLTADTNLLALGVIDSLSMVSLRIFIERTFELRLPDGIQPESFKSIETITDMVEKLQAESS